MNADENLPLKPVAEKGLTAATSVWVCGECKNLRKTRKEADECCVCECGKYVRQLKHGCREPRCERCQIRSAIRYAQESIRRDKDSLKSSENHLHGLRRRKAEIT